MGLIHKYSDEEVGNLSLGQKGSKFIDDVAQHTGVFVAITALEDSVIDVADSTIITNSMEGADTNFTIPKGVTIFGSFTTVSLDSGKVIAYKG